MVARRSAVLIWLIAAVFIDRGLSEESSETGRWEVHSISVTPIMTQDGSIWWLDAAQTPGSLYRWRDGNVTLIPIEESRLSAREIQLLRADTNGGLWILGSNDKPAACFNYGKWRIFEKTDAAWKTMAIEEKNNPDFRIIRGGPSAPAFSSGMTAYRDMSLGRIRFFDGTNWLIISTWPPNDQQFMEQPVAFVDNVLTARFRSGYFQFINEEWKSYSPKRELPNESAFVQTIEIAPPASFPGEKNNRTISMIDNAGTAWMGTLTELYRGIEDSWIRFPTAGSPLNQAQRVAGILIDTTGDPWFLLQNSGSNQLVHYACSGTAPKLGWAKPPASAISTAKAELSIRIDSIKGRGALRYRSDSGPWRQTALTPPLHQVVVDNLSNGLHKIEIRAFDELLRSSQLLTCTFTVKRDYGAEIAKLIPLLGSHDLKQREEAARTLVSIGTPAVPALLAQKQMADSSQTWWIQAIIEEINRAKN
jgi:hypothetical protein